MGNHDRWEISTLENNDFFKTKFFVVRISHVFVAIGAESLVTTQKPEIKIFKSLEMVEKKV